MSQRTMCVRWCLPLALLALPSLSPAQAPSSEDDSQGVLYARDRAKALFESTQAKPRELAQKRRDAAATARNVRYEKYCAGAQDVTQDLVLQAGRHWLEAELALCDSPAERVAIHERYWDFTWSLEEIGRRKYQAGRISLADYARAVHARLDAEIRLAEARAKLKGK